VGGSPIFLLCYGRLLYAVQYFIGFKESKDDILVGAHAWMAQPKVKTTVGQAVLVAEAGAALPGLEVAAKSSITSQQSKPRRAA